LILGAGTVGMNAARVAVGIGMETTVMNRGVDKLRRLDEIMSGSVKTLPATADALESEMGDADLIVGAVLVTGGRTPLLIRREMLSSMKKGAVIVDVSVDQGGCAETTRPTTHDDPVYTVDGVIHYAVANMPGAYPRTSTLALTNATLPYIRQLAGSGVDKALSEDPALKGAVNVRDGEIVHRALVGMAGS
jgi:alanine dehydrogenase